MNRIPIRFCLVMIGLMFLIGCAADPRETVAERNARWANAGAIFASGMQESGRIIAESSRYQPVYIQPVTQQQGSGVNPYNPYMHVNANERWGNPYNPYQSGW